MDSNRNLGLRKVKRDDVLTLTYSEMIDGVFDCSRVSAAASTRKLRLLAHLVVPDHIQQPDHIRSSRQILQNLDLPLYLLLLDGFQDLDDTFLVGGDVDGFKDL